MMLIISVISWRADWSFSRQIFENSDLKSQQFMQDSGLCIFNVSASLKSLTRLLFVSAWRVHQDRWDRRGMRGLRDPRWAFELGHCSMLRTSSSSHFFLFIWIKYVSQGIRGVEGNIGAPGITGARVRRILYNNIIFKFIFHQQVKIWISATFWSLILNLKCKKKNWKEIGSLGFFVHEAINPESSCRTNCTQVKASWDQSQSAAWTQLKLSASATLRPI